LPRGWRRTTRLPPSVHGGRCRRCRWHPRCRRRPRPPPPGGPRGPARRGGAAPPPPPRVGGASPLRSSFGADTGTDFYWRVRRGLLAEGRLPRAASVRADELANAFELAAEMPAVGRPELAVEGAP